VRLVFAQRADGLAFDLAAVNLGLQLFIDGIGNHLGGNGAIQLARFAGFAGEIQHQPADQIGDPAHLIV